MSRRRTVTHLADCSSESKRMTALSGTVQLMGAPAQELLVVVQVP